MRVAEHNLTPIVRRAVGRALAERGLETDGAAYPRTPRTAGVQVTTTPAEGPDRPGLPDDPPAAPRAGAALLSAEALLDVSDGGVIPLPHGTHITPLAREEAFRRGIRFTRASSPDAPEAGGAGPFRVAVGCDHGGYAAKVEVLAWLRELGHRPLDLGTMDETAVDYPDFARAVAEAVAGGRADLGVIVDGAGIGSAMTANKVPGIRAANCWNEASARNAREHNLANVLTLGGRMFTPGELHATLRAFLSTPWGGARHARRVAKITQLENRWTGAGRH